MRIDRPTLRILLIPILILSSISASAFGQTLEFAEDFSTSNFRDSALTTANWSIAESVVKLATPIPRSATFAPPINLDEDPRLSAAARFADVDGDGFLDILLGSSGDFTFLGDEALEGTLGQYTSESRTYLNNGTTDPFLGVAGIPITYETHTVELASLGDLNGDGTIDFVVSRVDKPPVIFFNNGTSDPWAGVTGREVGIHFYHTEDIGVADLNGDGHLDLLGTNGGENGGEPSIVYLNNGTNDPFQGVEGVFIPTAAHAAESLVLGDVNGDGFIDFIQGNGTEGGEDPTSQLNRVYLNNGTANPFEDVVGLDIGAEANFTKDVMLGDVDLDGDLDLVVGNDYPEPNLLYLNNGTDNPFGEVAPSVIQSSTHLTLSVVLADMNCDGLLDLIEGNVLAPIRILLNNGTSEAFTGVEPILIPTGETNDLVASEDLDVGDPDLDGDLDIAVAMHRFPEGVPSRFFKNQGDLDTSGVVLSSTGYCLHRNTAVSLGIDTTSKLILSATLTAQSTLPPNTSIQFWMTNNGGKKWFLVKPAQSFEFPTFGTDLRWKAELLSRSPALTPELKEIRVNALLGPTLSGVDRWDWYD
ncbi:MAG: VCBS repeat-containing protein [Candidatus Omnitrophica bacterium]|nr:VCBS repeat-containing protein [Candidatus Omnitrophota bacterium]